MGDSQTADPSGIPLLAKTKLFSYLDADGLRQLANRAITRRYRRGEVVFREGDPGNWLFVVASSFTRTRALHVAPSSVDVRIKISVSLFSLTVSSVYTR